jgi:hypothetical protein
MGMGVAGMIITSDDWDHSRKFPAFSTSKNLLNAHHFCSTNWGTPSQDFQLGHLVGAFRVWDELNLNTA